VIELKKYYLSCLWLSRTEIFSLGLWWFHSNVGRLPLLWYWIWIWRHFHVLVLKVSKKHTWKWRYQLVWPQTKTCQLVVQGSIRKHKSN